MHACCVPSHRIRRVATTDELHCAVNVNIRTRRKTKAVRTKAVRTKAVTNWAQGSIRVHVRYFMCDERGQRPGRLRLVVGV